MDGNYDISNKLCLPQYFIVKKERPEKRSFFQCLRRIMDPGFCHDPDSVGSTGFLIA